jgi:hypothetical protein
MGESDEIRVLRWVYVLGEARVTCELALDEQALIYEFRINRESGATRSVDRFEHVSRAFQRQSEFEAGLIADGWSLERYESAAPGAADSLGR